MLTDIQRKQIHDLALAARALLTREAREQLEGVYGCYADGRLDPAETLPQVRDDPEAAAIHARLARYLADERRAGLTGTEAVEKLVKETAFTHLNRCVAFKMLEARKLIRGTLDKGLASNAFKHYLADPAYAADLARHEQGDADTAYRHFLLWQAGQIAREVKVLFDPDTLPSRLFPRPRALADLLALLNAPELARVWLTEETIGWVYQFFNEEEKAAVFDRLYKQKQKIRREDIPAATQLFTPNWIVRTLVHNTLGRLWVDLHPDTRLRDADDLRFLISDLRLEEDDSEIVNRKSEIENPPRLVRSITLLDPACGGMHFGLVAFDLFAAMYQEELERAGEPGWPAAPSVNSLEEIPAAILKYNLFGIDIDLRAVQLSALALYLKAASWHAQHNTQAGSRSTFHVSRINLACADVQRFDPAALGAFVREARFTRPVYERLMRALWEKLQDVAQLGSLLRLEQALQELIEQERARYAKTPLFAGLPGVFEQEAAEEEYWNLISAQILQGLDEFVRAQAAAGVDQTFFTGEAVKGLRLADLMLRRYDVVVTNPPYSGKRNLNDTVAEYLNDEYPDAKGDLYTAFIQRCGEWVENHGRVGMITQQSFMFLSSYEKLRAGLRERFAIETMAHVGPRAFAEISGEKVNTVAFVLRAEPDTPRRESSTGTYFRLVNAGEGDAKRAAFEEAQAALRENAEALPPNVYRVEQRAFDAIPGSPWVYWIPDGLRALFETLPRLGDVAQPVVGTQTANNERFLRYWWEIGHTRIAFGCSDWEEAHSTDKVWFPYMKGGNYRKWYGNQDYIVNWYDSAEQIKSCRPASVIRNPDFYFHEGVTWSDLSSSGFGVRYLPPGFAFDVKGSSGFPSDNLRLTVLALMNSPWMGFALALLNPTVSFQVGDISRVPVKQPDKVLQERLEGMTQSAVHIRQHEAMQDETTYDFIAPPRWDTGLEDLAAAEARLAALEAQIDDEVYRLYGISDEDRAAIEAELSGGIGEIDDLRLTIDENADVENDADENEIVNRKSEIENRQELAVRWISYAVGIVLGRFTMGDLRLTSGDSEIVNRQSKIGNGVYRREGFAVGSLPAPDEAEFDALVGSAERFAYVDEAGGRHVFPAEVEAALRALALPDGIAVLDEGHPRDLPALVEQALTLMLDWDNVKRENHASRFTFHATPQTAAVIQAGAGGDLRAFLSKDFFTQWHFKWYRKRPVYWPLQSAKRGYGFVLFHEKVEQYTLYILMRDYLDYKRNGVQLALGDLAAQREAQSGAARKRVERRSAELTALQEELAAFAKTLDRLARAGYEPAPNWIDDGVLLRLAPLWEVIPLWKSEPRKAWEALEAGKYDWSHIALRYWPERVKAACRENKSYAIAHGIGDF